MMLILAEAVEKLFQIWSMILFIWVILSWIPQISRYHPVVQLLDRFVSPVVAPFRRLLPMSLGIDISPLIAYFVLQVVVQLVVVGLRTLSHLF